MAVSAAACALRSRVVRDGQLIHRSDKGACGVAFTQRLAKASVAPSAGGVGACVDTALAESLWSTIRAELISRHRKGDSPGYQLVLG